jgi:hypothetical protein
MTVLVSTRNQSCWKRISSRKNSRRPQQSAPAECGEHTSFSVRRKDGGRIAARSGMNLAFARMNLAAIMIPHLFRRVLRNPLHP